MTTHTVYSGQTVGELMISLYQLALADQIIHFQVIQPDGTAISCPVSIFEIPGSKDLKNRPMIGFQMQLDSPVICEDCGGSGLLDTGGVYPDGRSIEATCPTCSGRDCNRDTI